LKPGYCRQYTSHDGDTLKLVFQEEIEEYARLAEEIADITGNS
jgi:hypothetical protein